MFIPIVILALVLAPGQLVVVEFPGEGTSEETLVEGRFHALVQVRDDGTASGNATLLHQAPEDPEKWILLVVVVNQARFDPDGAIRFDGWGATHGKRGGRHPADRFEIGGTIDASEDDPIWQFHSGNVAYDGARFGALTRILLDEPAETPRR